MLVFTRTECELVLDIRRKKKAGKVSYHRNDVVNKVDSVVSKARKEDFDLIAWHGKYPFMSYKKIPLVDRRNRTGHYLNYN